MAVSFVGWGPSEGLGEYAPGEWGSQGKYGGDGARERLKRRGMAEGQNIFCDYYIFYLTS
jgi:hypothetical protein